jgi:hypothetical protein
MKPLATISFAAALAVSLPAAADEPLKFGMLGGGGRTGSCGAYARATPGTIDDVRYNSWVLGWLTGFNMSVAAAVNDPTQSFRVTGDAPNASILSLSATGQTGTFRLFHGLQALRLAHGYDRPRLARWEGPR